MPTIAAHLGLTSSDLLARFNIPLPTEHTAIATMLRQHSNAERPLQLGTISPDEPFWEVGSTEAVVNGLIVNKHRATFD